MSATRFRLVFHVPPSAAAACKTAIFAAGAGRQGNYSECCFTAAAGTGQFRPTAGANPAVGKVGALEEVEEVVVETLCVGEETTRKAVAALKRYGAYLPTYTSPPSFPVLVLFIYIYKPLYFLPFFKSPYFFSISRQMTRSPKIPGSF